MNYPKKQYVIARTRGSRTDYFYGTKLGELVKAHVKVGDEFQYTTLRTGAWRLAERTSESNYSIEHIEAGMVPAKG